MTGYKEIKEEFRNSKEECIKIKQKLANTDEYLNYTVGQLANTDEDLKNTKDQLANTDEDLKNTKEKLANTDEDLKNTKEQLANTDEDLKQANKHLQQIGIENLIKQEDERIKKVELREKYKVQLIEARKPHPKGWNCKLIFNFYSFMNYIHFQS